MDGPELLKRIDEKRCLRCNWGPLKNDPESGFPEHYCVTCKLWLASRPGPNAGAARARRTHKERGIQNLLDLDA